MSGMIIRLQSDQRGVMNTLTIPLIMSVFLLILAICFGLWAFVERNDYKTNVDDKVESAVKVAVDKANTEKDNEFLEKEKEPYKTYSSPSQYGAFTFQYPKTWSAYANEQPEEITLTMHPDVIASNPKTAQALKVQVLNRQYDTVVKSLESEIKQGKLTAAAYALPSVPESVGLRVDGQITTDKRGAAVYIPIRDKTIIITTESPEKVAELNEIILKSFTFKP